MSSVMSYNVFRSLISLTSILFNKHILHIFWVSYYVLTLCIVNGICICIYTHTCVHNQLFQLYLTVFDHMDCSPPLSRAFSWREYWSGLPSPPPGDLPNPVITPTFPVSPAFQADSLLLHHLGSHIYAYFWFLHVIYYINILIYLYVIYALTRYLLVEFVSFYLAELTIVRGFLNSHLWQGSLRFSVRKNMPFAVMRESNFFFSHTVCLVWLLLLISEISRLICFVQLYMNLHFRIFL